MSQGVRTAGALLVVLGIAANSSIAGSAPSSGILLKVFDCYMPLPKGLVLNSKEKNRIVLSLGAPFEALQISIADYAHELGSEFEQRSTRQVGGLSVEEWTNDLRKDIRVTRVHDGRQQIVVYGGTDDLLNSMVSGCLDHKHGTLFDE